MLFISEHSVDFVGDGGDQGFEEVCGCDTIGFLDQLHESELSGSIAMATRVIDIAERVRKTRSSAFITKWTYRTTSLLAKTRAYLNPLKA
jgi:hypothetical protein